MEFLSGYLKSAKHHYTRPPNPPNWGTLSGLKSPNLGDLGGECRVFETSQTAEILAISESALQKDWLKPEEDEAWQHL